MAPPTFWQSIPFIGRLNIADYIRLFLSCLVLLTLSLIKILCFIIPLEFVFEVVRKQLLSQFIVPDVKSARKRISGRESVFEDLNTTEDFVRFWGYPFETHYVPTTDKFILTLHRIPHSRTEELEQKNRPHFLSRSSSTDSTSSSASTSASSSPPPNNNTTTTINQQQQNGATTKRRRPVVLFWHGFLMCSEVWVCRPNPHSNLPMLLADLGYDVWMGNTRGNKYSCKHMLHDPSQTAYWDFSLDHLALYDLPDTITHILQLTGEPSLSYVGFSQGTVQGFAALSIHPHLDTSQINLFVALAPVIKPHGLDNKMVASLVNASPDLIYLIFGRRCMLASEPFWRTFLSISTFVATLDVAMRGLFGWRSEWLPDKSIIYRHLYSFTSVKIVCHWFQVIRYGRLQMYDESPPLIPQVSSNTATSTGVSLASKGRITPKFPTELIKTPIALFFGGKDTLLDMDVLLERIGVPPVFCLKVEEYEHLHFLWGLNIEKVVFPSIFKLLERYRTCSIPVMNSSSSLDDLEVYPLDEDLFWKGQGRPVGCGEVVAPLDLCWGLHSERGPIYEDMDEEDVEEEDADKANDFVSPAPVVGRSIRRLENIAVKDGMVNVIVFDATVSIGAAGQGDLIDFKADLKEPLKRSGSLFRRNRHKRRVR